jgi:hypothetical protein
MSLRWMRVALVSGLLLLSGYASAVVANDQVGLQEQAKKLWEARVKNDGSVLYDYLSTAEKQQSSREEFSAWSKENAPFQYLSYHLGVVETDGNLGWVQVGFSVRPAKYPNLSPTELEVWQLWRKDGDAWRPVPQEQVNEYPAPIHRRNAAQELSLARRAAAFWEARARQDHGGLYSLCDPTYRSRVSRDEFLQMKARYLYLSHRIDWTEVIGDQGRVRVTYTYKPSDPSLGKLEPKQETVVETWIQVDGEWYRHIPETQGEE